MLQEETQVLISTSTETVSEDLLTQTDCEIDQIPQPNDEPLNLCIQNTNDSEAIDLSNGALDLRMKK